MGTQRRFAAAALVASAALLLSGCGGGGGGKHASGTPAPSADASHAAHGGGSGSNGSGSDGPGSGDGGASTQPSPSSTVALATMKGEAGMTVAITSAERDPGGFVTVSGTITNGGTQPFTANAWRGNEEALVKSGASVAGATLVDEKGKRRYYVLRDTDGQCLCTRSLVAIPPGQTLPFYAQFPSPPESVTQVDFELPTMPPAGIQLTDGTS
jgi:hypothetical protein